MAEINRAVKGTNDILPDESHNWQFVEGMMLDVASLYGFKEIRVIGFYPKNFNLVAKCRLVKI